MDLWLVDGSCVIDCNFSCFKALLDEFRFSKSPYRKFYSLSKIMNLLIFNTFHIKDGVLPLMRIIRPRHLHFKTIIFLSSHLSFNSFYFVGLLSNNLFIYIVIIILFSFTWPFVAFYFSVQRETFYAVVIIMIILVLWHHVCCKRGFLCRWISYI